MSRFKPKPKRPPYSIKNYYGLNEAVGQTEIKEGESVFQENYRITKNMKLQKRPGHQTFINFGAGNVQGIWEGTINSKNIMLACWNGNVYEYDMSIITETILIADLIIEGTVTIIGTISDLKTCIFWFESKIYFKNNGTYKEYDGTTFQNVVGYSPTIAIGSSPSGGGTLFEELNLLTGSKKQTFVGDNTTLYQLAESSIDADILVVTVDGVTKIETVDFAVDRTLGQVTFVVAPATNSDVSITWVKVIAGNADLVLKNKYAVDFGVSNDTNLFMWGNLDRKNVFMFSGVLKANYFPANAFVRVGTDEFRITDLKAQQQNLLVFKENETKIVTPAVNSLFSNNSGLNPFNYPYQDLNENVGNLADKGVQLIEDSPISLDGFSMWKWVIGTATEFQRNANIISDKIQLSLESLNLENSVTFNYKNQKEYWLNIDDTVYIWNYGNDTFYKYKNVNAVQFLDVEGQVYYAGNGIVERFSANYLSDLIALGTTIPCRIALGFTDMGALELKKGMSKQWLAINPSFRTSANIKFVTDKDMEQDVITYVVRYDLMNFDDVDFNNFSFNGNYNPQAKRIRGRVRGATYLQVIIENDTNNESLTILKLLMQMQGQGFSG